MLTPTQLNRLNKNFTSDRSDHAEHLNCQNLAKLIGFGGIYEKLLSDPYFLFVIVEAMFFNRSKIPTSVLYRIP